VGKRSEEDLGKQEGVAGAAEHSDDDGLECGRHAIGDEVVVLK
jgi:hypothetical protein